MTINLFEAPKTDGDENLDPNKKVLDELVGEGKKFKTVEDLARAKLESDRFIEQIKNENKGIREDLNTRLTLEQLLDKFNSSKESNTNSNQNNQDGTNGDEDKGTKTFSEEDLLQLVDKKINEKETVRVQNENLTRVRTTLQSMFGNEYVSKLKEVATKLSVDEEFLQDMAKNKPSVFLKLIETEATSTNHSKVDNNLFVPPNGENRPKFSPSGERKMSFYENIRRTNPTEYWSPKVQNQLHQDALRLKEAFFDT